VRPHRADDHFILCSAFVFILLLLFLLPFHLSELVPILFPKWHSLKPMNSTCSRISSIVQVTKEGLNCYLNKNHFFYVHHQLNLPQYYHSYPKLNHHKMSRGFQNPNLFLYWHLFATNSIYLYID